jgi:hypothetical protein
MHTGYLRLQTHTIRLCNTHCFSTTTMVFRTRLIVTLYVQSIGCLVAMLRYTYSPVHWLSCCNVTLHVQCSPLAVLFLLCFLFAPDIYGISLLSDACSLSSWGSQLLNDSENYSFRPKHKSILKGFRFPPCIMVITFISRLMHSNIQNLDFKIYVV